MGSPQDSYAANLIQCCGYPLHSPEPTNGLEEQYRTEGFQIGDVGHINRHGEFNPLFNICQPLPPGLLKRGFPEHEPADFGDPYRKVLALDPKHVFVNGAKREVGASSLSPGVAYRFTAKSNAGAVLILPSGATFYDLPQDKSLFQEAAKKHARHWCESAKQQSLYLVTGMYKTRDFILTSFDTADPSQEMLVKEILPATAHKYVWECGSTAYSRVGPANNEYENQTVLIQGFRMTMR